jgi:hypothetical protein
VLLHAHQVDFVLKTALGAEGPLLGAFVSFRVCADDFRFTAIPGHTHRVRVALGMAFAFG